jgi:hypothetical protein
MIGTEMYDLYDYDGDNQFIGKVGEKQDFRTGNFLR